MRAGLTVLASRGQAEAMCKARRMLRRAGKGYRAPLGRSWAICLCVCAFMRTFTIRASYIQYGGGVVCLQKF